MIRWNRREFMQASAASLLLNGVKGSASPGKPANDAGAPAFVHTNAEGKSWTVGNGFVEREIHFEAEHGLSTASWRHLVTGTDFADTPHGRRRNKGAEFSFWVDGDSLAGSNPSAWEFIEAKTGTVTPSGQSLALKLRAKSRPIEVTVFYAVYDAHPVVQKWIAITNGGSDPVTLSHLSFESLSITPGAPEVLQVSGFYGSQPREIFFTGRVDDTAVLERNSVTGEGYIAMNGAPGYTKRTEMVGWGDGVQLMYDTDLFPFERTLQPGETFTTAKSSIAFFADGKGFCRPTLVNALVHFAGLDEEGGGLSTAMDLQHLGAL